MFTADVWQREETNGAKAHLFAARSAQIFESSRLGESEAGRVPSPRLKQVGGPRLAPLKKTTTFARLGQRLSFASATPNGVNFEPPRRSSRGRRRFPLGAETCCRSSLASLGGSGGGRRRSHCSRLETTRTGEQQQQQELKLISRRLRLSLTEKKPSLFGPIQV